jgi:hypothetical protein
MKFFYFLPAAFFFFFLNFPLHSQGTPVFDAANLMQAIIQAQSMIDQINASVDQVMNSYEQIRQQVSMVKTLDPRNIDLSSFSGVSLPGFGDPLKSARNLIEENINLLKDVEYTLSAKKMKFAGKDYTLGGLFGLGEKEGEALVQGLSKSIVDHVRETGKGIAEDFKKKLSPDEIGAIMRRYGMSPENFASFKMTEEVFNDTLKKMFITGSGEHARLAMEAVGKKTGALGTLVQNAGESVVSQVEAASAGIGSVVSGIEMVEESLNRLGSFLAQQEIAKKAKEEFEADLREAAALAEEELRKNMSRFPEGYF